LVGTRFKAIALCAALQLAAGLPRALAAQDELDQYVPTAPTGLVSDFASVLDAESERRMTDLITRLRGVTRAEIAVVTLPTIGDRSASEVALAIGRKWGVGAAAELGDPARNAGLVLLLVPRQGGREGSGHIRIEVGRGLEGFVTDAMSGRIRDNVMGPLLAREEYGPALRAGVEALTSVIARGFGVSDSTLTQWQPPAPGGAGGSGWSAYLPILLFLLIFFLMNSGGGGRGRREAVPHRVGDSRIAAPRPAHDDLLGVRERDRGGDDARQGTCHRLERVAP
jgi:uncharacterized protein